MKTFMISALAAVGFSEEPLPAVHLPQTDDVSPNAFNSILDRSLSFTLVQHQSHVSHSSHYSHYSHRSYSSLSQPTETENQLASLDTTRNKNSTPPSSILPSSPALNLEKLHGNSAKFAQLASKVQMQLYAYGYYTGEISGIADTDTSIALSKYQKANGLEITGKIDDASVKMMNLSVD